MLRDEKKIQKDVSSLRVHLKIQCNPYQMPMRVFWMEFDMIRGSSGRENIQNTKEPPQQAPPLKCPEQSPLLTASSTPRPWPQPHPFQSPPQRATSQRTPGSWSWQGKGVRTWGTACWDGSSTLIVQSAFSLLDFSLGVVWMRLIPTLSFRCGHMTKACLRSPSGTSPKPGQ